MLRFSRLRLSLREKRGDNLEHNKTILVTGANRGIGLAVTTECLSRGWKVFGSARKPQTCRAFKDLSSKYCGLFTAFCMDITDERSISRAKAFVSKKTRSLDVIVNNAGICFDKESLSTFDAYDAEKSFAVNATGSILVVKHFISILRKGKLPKIVNISSLSGSISRVAGFSGHYSYKASKAALNMFSRILANELKESGITVLIVHPGLVKTRMNPDAKMCPKESAVKILELVERMGIKDTGSFFSVNSEYCPW